MINLKELNFNLRIENQHKTVDAIEINQIWTSMPQLETFNFYIQNTIELRYLKVNFSSEDIRRKFTSIGYEHMGYFCTKNFANITCHIFSLPFVFDILYIIGSTFPSVVYLHVTCLNLRLLDTIILKEEFFLRIARCFPMLECFSLSNISSSLVDEMNVDDKQWNFPVEYPHLISLTLQYSPNVYVEQFLNDTKIRLPHLRILTVDYDTLVIVTENFTKETTRNTCANVKKLCGGPFAVYSKDFYDYFPQLLCVSDFNVWTWC